MLDAHPGATPAATADRLSTKASGRAVVTERRPSKKKRDLVDVDRPQRRRRARRGRAGLLVDGAAVAARSWVG